MNACMDQYSTSYGGEKWCKQCSGYTVHVRGLLQNNFLRCFKYFAGRSCYLGSRACGFEHLRDKEANGASGIDNANPTSSGFLENDDESQVFKQAAQHSKPDRMQSVNDEL
jgi:hypothetical protein